MPRSRIEKILSYPIKYPNGNPDTAALAGGDWWEGFEWVSGPWQVNWKSKDHGVLQVWGITEEEGMGVIRHALAHMGVQESAGRYRNVLVEHPRFGQVRRVRATMVSARNGASGKPHAVILDYTALA